MRNSIRERALSVLAAPEDASDLAIHNSIVDLRRNSERGDEQVLRPFLDHDDTMVVAATLYTLTEIHGLRGELRPVLQQLMCGDARERDDLDKPIQCMAISLMSYFGQDDDDAVRRIWVVAEDEDTADTPKACAWERLADLHNAEWPNNATEELILRPEGEASKQIRKSIRGVCEAHRGGPTDRGA